MAVQNHLLSNTVLIKPDESDDSDSSLQGETLKVQVNTKSETPLPSLSPDPGAAASSANGYGPFRAHRLWSWCRDWVLQLGFPKEPQLFTLLGVALAKSYRGLLQNPGPAPLLLLLQLRKLVPG